MRFPANGLSRVFHKWSYREHCGDFTQQLTLAECEAIIAEINATNSRPSNFTQNKETKMTTTSPEQLDRVANSDLGKKYRREYEACQRIHDELGVSLEEYIEQRMIEDGLKPEPPLIPGNQSKA